MKDGTKGKGDYNLYLISKWINFCKGDFFLNGKLFTCKHTGKKLLCGSQLCADADETFEKIR